MLLQMLLLFLVLTLLYGCIKSTPSVPHFLNDVHSRLNQTEVSEIHYPESMQDVVQIVREAIKKDRGISVSGGKHAMGGQQFGKDTIHMNTSRMNNILSFDRQKGVVRVEAGIEWPRLMEYLTEVQKGNSVSWGITQKQTGADRLSLGGALSANVHGRGANFKPIIQDIDSFTLVNHKGEALTVSRNQNSELFKLAIGGYGLFGVITTVDLRLSPRVKLKRVVEVISIDDLPARTRERIEDGFLYGDFQYKTDVKAHDFLKVGVFSTYQPISQETPVPEEQKRLTAENWNHILMLAHTDKSKAFEIYSKYYVTTNGQLYWSDAHQMSYYNENYEEYLRKTIPDYEEGSLMISEVYVPRPQLNEFISKIAEDAKAFEYDIIYGTMRLIKRDDESFLAWAKDDYACIIFNLRVGHTKEGLEKAKHDFQKIIDRALDYGGSYYLTYHRWARKDQVLKAYPQFPEFLKYKLEYDPEERFQSDWYRHYKDMFRDEIGQAVGLQHIGRN